MKTGMKEGRREGMSKRRKEGRMEGRKEGRKKGHKGEGRKVVRNPKSACNHCCVFSHQKKRKEIRMDGWMDDP